MPKSWLPAYSYWEVVVPLGGGAQWKLGHWECDLEGDFRTPTSPSLFASQLP
jgi:hypothetical protein